MSARALLLACVVLLAAVGGGGGVDAGAAAGSVRQSTAAALADGGATVTVAYRLPDGVTNLTLTLPGAASDGSRVTAMDGFRRIDATTFEWTGAANPRVELSLAAEATRVLAGEGWALVVEPDATTSYGYRGSDPGFESSFAAAGEGYAAGSIAYLGPHRTATVVAGGERTTFVVSTAANPIDVSGAASFLRLAPGHFDFGVRREATTAFVIPDRRDPTAGPRIVGAALRSSLWVGPAAVRPNGTGVVTFAHEYVHTRLGVVGEGSARWLTEATAEYFGHAFALNAGVGDYGTFHRDLDPGRFGGDPGSVVLTDPDTWGGHTAPYAKGAHVLAALDAEIRRRTDGRHDLADVFAERPGPYADHAAFRRAVVATTGVESLAAWIDRYAATDAVPAVPDEPSLFVYGPDLDPDGDGVASGRERVRGTNPFAAPPETEATTAPATAARSGTPPRTPTAPATAEGSVTTTGAAGGFGAPGALAALGLAALSGALAARRRR